MINRYMNQLIRSKYEIIAEVHDNTVRKTEIRIVRSVITLQTFWYPFPVAGIPAKLYFILRITCAIRIGVQHHAIKHKQQFGFDGTPQQSHNDVLQCCVGTSNTDTPGTPPPVIYVMLLLSLVVIFGYGTVIIPPL